MTVKLTPTQSKALHYIREQTDRSGMAPSLRELCDYMGYSAVGSAQDLVNALRRKGYLETPDRQAARSMVLTPRAQQESHTDEEYDPNTYIIPCVGSVPAGNPVEAVEEHIGKLRISIGMLPPPRPRGDQLFALQATGESMVEAGIFDGDWLVVKTQKDAQVGDIVVARFQEDATVKRFLKDPKRGYFLQPENSKFSPIYGDEEPFELVGKVIALQRVLS